VLVLLAALSMTGAVLAKHHCHAAGWSTPDQFWHVCYSDIPVLYASSALGTDGRPSLVAALGEGGLAQPPLTGAAIWAVSGLVNLTSGVRGDYEVFIESRRFFDVSAVLLTAVLISAVVAVALTAGPRRRWDAAHLALSPVLPAAALVSYDLLAVGFVAWAFWAWSRSRPLAAGVLIGLAICTRPVTGVLLLALLGVGARAGRWRALALAGAGTAASWLAVRLILFADPWSALAGSWQAWKDSTAGYGSLWLVPSLLAQSKPLAAGHWYDAGALNGQQTTMITLIGLAVLTVATMWLALSTRYRPRVAHLALFAMAGGLLVVKGMPAQVGLLLLPVIALAGLKWRDHLIWATAEIVHFVGVWLYIAASSDANRGLPAGFYLVLVLVRAGAVVNLAVQAVRMARDPLIDPVRVPVDPIERTTDDDPAGGVVDDAPDVLVARA
jgi:uncharacterized membrane protein